MLDLERYARHLSLPAIGTSGQEALCRLRIACALVAPWTKSLVQALERSGVTVVSYEAPLTIEKSHAIGIVTLADKGVMVGADSHLGAIESHWLGALVACEIMLWQVHKRPNQYSLQYRFPEFQLHLSSTR